MKSSFARGGVRAAPFLSPCETLAKAAAFPAEEALFEQIHANLRAVDTSKPYNFRATARLLIKDVHGIVVDWHV